MTMRILIVEDNPALARIYLDKLKALMPDARIDAVASVGGYLRLSADTFYDVCVMDDTISERRSAFRKIAPLIARKFPGAVILHNSSVTDAAGIAEVERRTGARFARDKDGNVITFNKDVKAIAGFISTKVVPKDERKGLPPHNSMPVCQRPETANRKHLCAAGPPDYLSSPSKAVITSNPLVYILSGLK